MKPSQVGDIDSLLKDCGSISRCLEGDALTPPYAKASRADREKRKKFLDAILSKGSDILREGQDKMERMEDGMKEKYMKAMEHMKMAVAIMKEMDEMKEEDMGEEGMEEEGARSEDKSNEEMKRSINDLAYNNVLRQMEERATSNYRLSKEERVAPVGAIGVNNGKYSQKEAIEVLFSNPLASIARGVKLNGKQAEVCDKHNQFPLFLHRSEQRHYIENMCPGLYERMLNEKKRSITGTGTGALSGDDKLIQTSLDLVASPGLVHLTDMHRLSAGTSSFNIASSPDVEEITDEGSVVASHVYTNTELDLRPVRLSFRIDLTGHAMLQEPQIQRLAMEQISKFASLAMSENVITMNITSGGQQGYGVGVAHTTGVADIATYSPDNYASIVEDSSASSISLAQLGQVLDRLAEVPESYNSRMVATSPIGATLFQRKTEQYYNRSHLVSVNKDGSQPKSFVSGKDIPFSAFSLANQFPVYTLDHLHVAGSKFYPAALNGETSNSQLLAGDFSTIKTCLWGGLRIVKDETTDAHRDTTRLIATVYFSVGITRPSLLTYSDTFGITVSGI